MDDSEADKDSGEFISDESLNLTIGNILSFSIKYF